MEYKNIKWFLENSPKIEIHRTNIKVKPSKYYDFKWTMMSSSYDDRLWDANYSTFVFISDFVIEFKLPTISRLSGKEFLSGKKFLSQGSPHPDLPTKNADEFQKECVALSSDKDMMNAIKLMMVL